jgi:hypothetical protein
MEMEMNSASEDFSDDEGIDSSVEAKIVADRPSAAKVVTDRPGAAKVVTDRPGAAKVVTDRPGAAKIVTDRPGAAKIVTNQPSAAKVVADRSSVAKVATDRPSAAKAVADRPSAAKVVADQPSAAKVPAALKQCVKVALPRVQKISLDLANLVARQGAREIPAKGLEFLSNAPSDFLEYLEAALKGANIQGGSVPKAGQAQQPEKRKQIMPKSQSPASIAVAAARRLQGEPNGEWEQMVNGRIIPVSVVANRNRPRRARRETSDPTAVLNRLMKGEKLQEERHFSTIYFTGLRSGPLGLIRSILPQLGIAREWVREIQFFGDNGTTVTELLVYGEKKDEIIQKLQKTPDGDCTPLVVLEDYDIFASLDSDALTMAKIGGVLKRLRKARDLQREKARHLARKMYAAMVATGETILKALIECNPIKKGSAMQVEPSKQSDQDVQ